MSDMMREAMNDELRTACERCRDFLETGVWYDLPAMPIDAAEDLMIIARHYLATTREDDGDAWQGEIWISPTGGFVIPVDQQGNPNTMRDNGWRMIQVRELKEGGGGA